MKTKSKMEEEEEATASCFLCMKNTFFLCDIDNNKVPCSQMAYSDCISELIGKEFSLSIHKENVKICFDCCELFNERDTLKADLQSLEDRLTSLIASSFSAIEDVDVMELMPKTSQLNKSAEDDPTLEIFKNALPVEYCVEENGAQHCMVTIKDVKDRYDSPRTSQPLIELEDLLSVSANCVKNAISGKITNQKKSKNIRKKINIPKPNNKKGKGKNMENYIPLCKKSCTVRYKPEARKSNKNSSSPVVQIINFDNRTLTRSKSIQNIMPKLSSVMPNPVQNIVPILQSNAANPLSNEPPELVPIISVQPSKNYITPPITTPLTSSITLQTTTGDAVLQKLGSGSPILTHDTLAALASKHQLVTSTGKMLDISSIKKVTMVDKSSILLKNTKVISQNNNLKVAIPRLVPLSNTSKLAPIIPQLLPKSLKLTLNTSEPEPCSSELVPNYSKSTSNSQQLSPIIPQLLPRTLILPPNTSEVPITSESIPSTETHNPTNLTLISPQLTSNIPQLVPITSPSTSKSTPITTQLPPNTQVAGILTPTTQSSSENIKTPQIYCANKSIVYQCKNCNLLTTDLNYIKNLHQCTKNKCELCNYVADTSKLLKEHKIQHHNTCSKCDKKFDNNEDLIQHLQVEHVSIILPKPSNWSPIGSVMVVRKPSSIKITSAKNTNLLANYCNTHEISHIYSTLSIGVRDGKVQCGVCKIVQKDTIEFDKHFLVHLHEFIQCKYCKIILSNIKDYLKHTLYHEVKTYKEKSFNCLECGVKVNKLGGLKLHMKTEHGLKHTCGECSEQFLTSVILQRHIEEHDVITSFQCDHCTRSFKRKGALQKHLITHKKLKRDGKIYEGGICSFCGQIFKSEVTLKKHEKLHTEPTRQCKICNRILKTERSLIAHMKLHTNDYSHRCQYCDRGFISKQATQEHENNAHVAEKQYFYTCDICNKQFRHYGSYNTHIKWHDDPYPGKCTLCEYKSRYKHLVDIHMRTVHTKETYNCTACDKKYFAKYLLKRHMSKHTGKYIYNCDDCNRGWNIKAHFRMHKFKVHNVPLPEKVIKTKDDFKLVLPDLPASVPGLKQV